jgi:hypothetical protein
LSSDTCAFIRINGLGHWYENSDGVTKMDDVAEGKHTEGPNQRGKKQ